MEEKAFKKVEVEESRKVELLQMVVSGIFGLNTNIDFSKWTWEEDKLIIKDIDWSEDLLGVLNRLRDYFYIDLDSEVEQSEFNGEKVPFSKINIELVPKW